MITQTLSGSFGRLVYEEIVSDNRWMPLRMGVKRLADTVQIKIDHDPDRARLALALLELIEGRNTWPSSSKKAIVAARRRLDAIVAR